jgi:hypothetical protein
LRWGLKSHSLGIFPGIVRSITASFFLVHFHNCSPSPHSVSRCMSVSCLSQCRDLSVEAMHIFLAFRSWGECRLLPFIMPLLFPLLPVFQLGFPHRGAVCIWP